MRVALLGTGIMGAGMATNLARAGHDVVVWNRTRERAEATGLTVVDTPAAAADGADLLVTMMFDADATESAMVGPDGALAAAVLPPVWVQSATVGDDVHRLAALVEGTDMAFLDGPVMGTRGPAEAGELRSLLSGDPAARAHAMPAVEAWSSVVIETGDDIGSASRMKLAVNATLGMVNGVAAEALRLADRLGVGAETLLGALGGGPLFAPVMAVKARMMLDGDLDPHFPLAGLHKDVGLARVAADLGEAELPLMAGTLEALQRAMDAGLGDRDMAAVHRAL